MESTRPLQTLNFQATERPFMIAANSRHSSTHFGHKKQRSTDGQMTSVWSRFPESWQTEDLVHQSPYCCSQVQKADVSALDKWALWFLLDLFDTFAELH